MPVALRIAVIVIEVTGIVLLTLLLATPARKHFIVDALVVTTILRSLFDVIPPILREALPGRFADLESHMSILRFCIADQIIVRYLTVVKAAFIVDFTLPVLYLAIKHSSKDKQRNPAQSPCQFYRTTILTFCAAPFVWALPVLLVPLRSLDRNPLGLKPYFYAIHCVIADDAFQVVSIVLTMVPMMIALITSTVIVVYLWKFCDLPILSRTLGMLDALRVYRFAALCLTIVISAVLYCAVLGAWAQHHIFKYGVMSASIVWEAISPCIIFLIFFAQKEVYDIWRESCARLLCRPRQSRTTSSTAQPCLDASMGSDEDHRDGKPLPTAADIAILHDPGQEHIRNLDNFLTITPRAGYIPGPILGPTIPGQIMYFDTPAFDYYDVHHSHRVRPQSQAPVLSLTPPPRPVRSRSHSRSQSPAEPTREIAFTHMPSLTAFGGRGSSENASKISVLLGGDEPQEHALNGHRSGSESRSRAESRPLTASSSRTFDSGSDRVSSYAAAG
ncbi:hypothetical protein CERSUDRAFT_90689 [Gelatoporia subvermispora B]|uniref:Uncharacterized protein n=1 Tax=Ceriporiopsis subvermispora (strain B) TaxID=914234 RepID=M2RT31_CERS8|nr:hypothetical protein CERSUDRAFT_90689 [Gelatoporia subvermispora B]